jgi:flagellar motor switch/type III secretory pathway protein FliN
VELCGVPVEVRLRAVGVADPRVLDPGAVGVLLSDARASLDGSAAVRAILVEVEAALAVAGASRALERKAARVVDPLKASTPALAGAAGAILVAVSRRASAEPLRALACGSAASLWAEANRLDPNRVAATFTVLVGDDAFVARVSVGRERQVRTLPMDTGTLSRMGRTPLELPIVAACSSATRSEIDALRVGDAWMPGADFFRAGTFAGDVTLCAPNAESGARARLGEDGRLVLLDGASPLPWTVAAEESAAMSGSSETKGALVETLGESPVIVRVEIGTAKLAAREWASLGAGDVIAIGRRIGEPVVLRVGGEEVARGELVDVDGEVGVRLLSRAGASS